LSTKRLDKICNRHVIRTVPNSILFTIFVNIGITVDVGNSPKNNKTVGICVSKVNINKRNESKQARCLVAYRAQLKHSIKRRSQAIILEYHIAEKFNKFNTMADI
jgi:hypothetical protein